MIYKTAEGSSFVELEDIISQLLEQNKFKSNKIIIIGSPGSGKSYLTKHIESFVDVPVYHMDAMFWRADKTHISYEELEEKIRNLVVENKWLIDGNYISSLEARLKAVQLVIYLDFSTEQCLEGLYKRVGSNREEMPWDKEELDEKFLEYVKGFRDTVRPEIEELLRKYLQLSVLRLFSKDEMDSFIEGLKCRNR